MTSPSAITRYQDVPGCTRRYNHHTVSLNVRFDVDEAERFVHDVCQGLLDVSKIAEQLPRFAG
jgi:hypothetical protein